MKLITDALPSYEYAFRQPELERPALRYDNRAVVAQSLGFWTTAQNPTEKIAAPESEVPSNAVSELLAERYVAGFAA